MKRADRIAVVFWRLVAALPPLVGSLFATDLSFSLLLSSVAGVYVAFIAPSLLQLASSNVGEQQPQHEPVTSIYLFQGWWSARWLPYPVLAFATFSLGTVLIQILNAVKRNEYG